MENNQEGIEVNRQILKLLVKGKGSSAIDEIDNTNGSTPLMYACEYLSDIELLKTLVDGGADINAVNNDNKMPLSLVRERLEKDQENAKLKEIYEYLQDKGAVLNWRDIPR